MSTIFPLSASVGQEFQGYMYDGTIWNLIGNEYNPTVYSAYEPDNPKPGDLWVDSSIDVPVLSINNVAYKTDLDDYLTLESASTNYATKTELNNIDALPSQSGNSGKYLTTNGTSASWATVDLSLKLDVTTASSTYLTQASASSIYATKQYADNSASVAAAAVVDAAPETLNTLNELAAALGDDANFASTVTASLGNKLDISSASTTYATISSPIFTGTSTFNDVVVNGKLSVSEILENVASASVSSQAVTLNYNDSNIFYINAPGSSFGVYLTNAPTNEDKTFTISIMVNQAAVGYRPNEFFINGNSQTIRWVGGSAPTPTSSSGKIDIFSFTIIRISGSWIVLGTHSTNF